MIGAVRLGAGHLLYEYPGYATFGGSMNQGLAGVISVQGAIGGEFNFDNGRFNLSGSVRGCLIGVICRSAFGLVSSRGAAACLGVGPLSIGGGVTWSPFGVRLWPLDGCKWSPFAERNIRAARARAAQTGVLQTIQIEKGDSSRAIELKGTAEAPRVRVTGPGGLVLDTPAGSGFVVNGAVRIIRQETTKLTVIGLQDPPPGTYTIAPLDGSPAVASLAVAEDQRPRA